jgi:hypothetical protein
VMAQVPLVAPLIHGVAYSSWFVWLSFRDWKEPGQRDGQAARPHTQRKTR